MMKKALALVGAIVLLLVMVGPAAGCWGSFCWWEGNDELTINNGAFVTNDVYTKADSGDNSIGGKIVWGGSIRTGAAGAVASVGNDVNGTYISDCDCVDGDIDIHNHAFLMNDITTKAYTGDNSIGGMWVGGGTITTGAASAGSYVTNFVNTVTMGYHE